jgi:hypothetical protein
VYIAIEDLMEEGKSLLLRDRQSDLEERPSFDSFFVMSELAERTTVLSIAVFW